MGWRAGAWRSLRWREVFFVRFVVRCSGQEGNDPVDSFRRKGTANESCISGERSQTQRCCQPRAGRHPLPEAACRSYTQLGVGF